LEHLAGGDEEMSDKINDGGPAFPGDDGWTDRGTHYHGMSIRDWFAGMALQGMLAANSPCMPEVSDKNVDAIMAREAYNSADAMLIKRQK
jgi:hypothetical protein